MILNWKLVCLILRKPDHLTRGLEVQAKEIGLAYWACRSCLAFANKVNRQLQAATKRQDEVEERVEQNIRETQHNKQEIEQLKEELRRVRNAAEAEKEERSDALAEELREREMRRNNIIIHGLREPEHLHQARDKMENDRQTCGEIFNIIGTRVRAADLRFCRRIGERGRDPRPLVIGMRSEEEKKRFWIERVHCGDQDWTTFQSDRTSQKCKEERRKN
jgi:hypothetical protein